MVRASERSPVGLAPFKMLRDSVVPNRSKEMHPGMKGVEGRGVEEGVEPVEEAAVPGEEAPRVLHGAAPLEGRLDEVSDDGDDGEDGPEKGAGRAGDDGRPRHAREDEREGRPEEGARGDLPPEALPALLRADDRREPALPRRPGQSLAVRGPNASANPPSGAR